MPSDGSLGHVGPDEAKLPLAVLAERADERRRPRRTARAQEHRDRAQAHAFSSSSMWSAASCSRRRAFSAFSIDRIVSPMVAPW